MKLNKFKELFAEPLPLELAFGYTSERYLLYINLYEDKVSRIVVDHNGSVVERIDASDDVIVDDLIRPHKRFYRNRVNERFRELVECFNLFGLAITNSDVHSVNPFIKD